jgi:hypothetical protein
MAFGGSSTETRTLFHLHSSLSVWLFHLCGLCPWAAPSSWPTWVGIRRSLDLESSLNDPSAAG